MLSIRADTKRPLTSILTLLVACVFFVGCRGCVDVDERVKQHRFQLKLNGLNKLSERLPASNKVPANVAGWRTTNAEKLKPIAKTKFGYLHSPNSLTYDETGDVLFASTKFDKTIYQMSADGTFGMPIHTAVEDITALSVDNSNSSYTLLWLATKLHTAVRVDLKGQPQGLPVQLHMAGVDLDARVSGLTRNPKDGHIYAVAETNRSISLVDMQMSDATNATTVSKASLAMDAVYDMDFDPQAGVIWLLDATNKLVHQVDLSGKVLKSWSIGIFEARGIAVGKDKLFIMAEEQHRRRMQVDRLGHRNDVGSVLFQFNKPTSMMSSDRSDMRTTVMQK